MRSYSLCADDNGTWSIVDEATQAAAKIDGICLSHMDSEEARQMLKVLRGIEQRGIEQIRSLSARSSASTRKLAKLSSNLTGRR
jgi:hypothetical protein